jgi:hypothetical protein
MPETEDSTNKNVSSGLVSLPSGTFEHDVAVSDRYQKFSSELLRLSIAAIGAIGFLVLNNVFSQGGRDQFNWLVKNTTFGFWLFISLFCFVLAAAFALLHFYFGADGKAYHLKYLRLENSLGDASKIRKIKKREDIGTCWDLYWNGKTYPDDDEEKIIKQAADERDVRNFLLKISGKVLFYSGILLWLGVITFAFTFIPVIFK